MGNCDCTLAVTAAFIGCLIGAAIVGFAIFGVHMTITLTTGSIAPDGELPESDQPGKKEVQE